MKKNRGFTLIEVILSVALMSILLIPASQIVITASKNSKVAQIKKESTDIGQSILENIRNIESVNETGSHDIEIESGNSNEKKVLYRQSSDINSEQYVTKIVDKNGKQSDLVVNKQFIDGNTHYIYNVPFANYKKNYKVDIQVNKEAEYENKKKDKQYIKNQSYVPSIGTESDLDKVSDKCKDDYDLIVKLTNDNYIFSGSDDSYFKYKKAESLVLVLDKDVSGDIVAYLHRNKGTTDDINVDADVIYSKKLFNINEIKNKFKDNVKVLFYLCNNDSQNKLNPYALNQSLIVQSKIDSDDTKALGEFSSDVLVDVLKGKKCSGNLDVMFDDKNGYIHNVNYFMYQGENAAKRTGNLYSFKVSVSLNDEEIFTSNTTGIIDD